MQNSKSGTEAFTRIELAIVITILGVMGALFLHAQDDPLAKQKQERLQCVNNLKQVGLAFRLWSNDNDGSYPMRVAAEKGGSREAIVTGETWRHFASLSNDLAQAKLITCPSDDRPRASSFTTLSNTNVSYFVGLEADETKPQMLLTGDRNLTNGLRLVNGVMTLNPNAPEGWTAAMHAQNGNVGMADGSAQQLSTAGLRNQIQAQDKTKDGPKRLLFPEL
jgi:hypothetical protein